MSTRAPFLCVNIDHIATVRQARLEDVPDPVAAAELCEKAGAIGITAHLREDRRHMQDLDIARLRKSVRGKFNLEMAATAEMLAIAKRIRPDEATLVPEKRRELTTEGGLKVAGAQARVGSAVAALRRGGTIVSLFITPDADEIAASAKVGADCVEFHTGAYAHAFKKSAAAARLEWGRLELATARAKSLGLVVNLGHGLTFENVGPVCRLAGVEDLNIGHNIVARACLVGMGRAVEEMLAAMKRRAGLKGLP
ncbi:MAG TPA: pyridoxine 5'-phosphate synthase [bacterium]|jgi:pyridoxine 5-phosphate synthase|nr:pyridoxine 5'-phosphate synthase [bacterium]